MKAFTCLNFVFCIVICASAQEASSIPPEWKATIKVVDEAAHPMQGVEVTIWHYVRPTNGASEASEKITGFTDATGIFSASAHSRSISLAFVAQESGYYTTTKGYELGPIFQYDAVKWSPNVSLTLKKIVEPIPMYAKSLNLGMPVFDKRVGFDLLTGDWVAPYGKGTNIDMIFNAHIDKIAEDNLDYKLAVGFPNPGDGIQEFTISQSDRESTLQSPHEAPSTGYQSEWTQAEIRRPRQEMKTTRDPNRGYFFRIKTQLDENGKVKSALYGKIYGDFLEFRYYLNPSPNSRNLEFDVKHNLLKGLKSFEQVNYP